MKFWSIRNLSIEGNEVFIKSVLQVIPTYAMQCFKLPVSLMPRFREYYVQILVAKFENIQGYSLVQVGEIVYSQGIMGDWI